MDSLQTPDPGKATRIEFVTSVNKPYYDKYGFRLLESLLKNTAGDINVRLYCEASNEGLTPEQYVLPSNSAGRVVVIDLFQNTLLEKFLLSARPIVESRIGPVLADPDARRRSERYNYRWDALTFGKKAFSLIHALRDTRAEYCIWVDSDTVFFKFMPTDFVMDLFGGEADVLYFGRTWPHSETGFVGFRMGSDGVNSFTRLYGEMWEGLGVLQLPDGWTDCDAFDAVLDTLRAAGRVKARSLSQSDEGHVIAGSVLRPYLDHMKGPRKERGFSPERAWHFWYRAKAVLKRLLKGAPARKKAVSEREDLE